MIGPATGDPAGCPPARGSVLAILQDQLDDLLAASQTQQATIDALHSRVQATIDVLRAETGDPQQRARPEPGGQ